MKAVVYQDLGSADVLKCQDIEKPTPGDNEVLIKVRAASLNPLDWKLMKGGPFILRLLLGLGKLKIKRPGVDVAGEVDAVGKNVAQFKPGDPVFGTCVGAFAEYATSQSARGMKSALVIKPDNLTFEQAASAPVAALTALQGLRDKARIQSGHRVLVNGATGGVGTFAVQIARSFGANVTGVCSTRNVDMVRSLGADQVIDYTQQDFTKSGQRYDIVLDCVGNHSFSEWTRVLNPKGILVGVGAPPDVPLSRLLAGLIGALVRSLFVSQKIAIFVARVNQQDLPTVGDLMAAGKVTPVIDRHYRLSEAREAFRYMELGHARGKVIITPEFSLEARVWAHDPTNDLALLKTSETAGTTLKFAENSQLRLGQNVIVIGYPLPDRLAHGVKVTTGNISSLAGMNDDTRKVRVTAPVQPGNSGGPVLDEGGNVIGVVVSTLGTVGTAVETGKIPQNMNFAIKASLARVFLDSNNVAYGTTVMDRRLDVSQISETAGQPILLVECWK